MADTNDDPPKKDTPPEADNTAEQQNSNTARDNLSSAADSANRNDLIKEAEKKSQGSVQDLLPNTIILDKGSKNPGEKAKPGDESKPGEKAKPGEKSKSGDGDQSTPGEAKKGAPKEGEAGEAKSAPKEAEEAGQTKDDRTVINEQLQKNKDGSFNAVKEFEPGSETAREVKHLDHNKKLLETSEFKKDGSSITKSADGRSVRTNSVSGDEAEYKLDKNKDLLSYKDSEGDWSKQNDGSWKNNSTGESFQGKRWLDENGALHIKNEKGEHSSKQLDGSSTKYDNKDRPEEITNKLGGKIKLGYQGDEREPNSIDYGTGKWTATNDEKTKWEKDLGSGKKQNWDGAIEVKNNQVVEKYLSEKSKGTEVSRNSDGSVVSKNKNGDLSEIAAGKNKYTVSYEKPGEANKITFADKTSIEKKADGWYSGNKKVYDSVSIDNKNNSITFQSPDGSKQLVDSSGNKNNYDSQGVLKSQDGADGSKTTFKQDEKGDYAGKEVQSPDKKTIRNFDHNNRLTDIESNGRKVSVERNESGAITKLSDSLGPVSFNSKDGGKTFTQEGSEQKIAGTPVLKNNGDYEFRAEGRSLSRTRDAVSVNTADGKTILNNDGSSLSLNNKTGEAEQSITAAGLRLAVKRESNPDDPTKAGKVSEARIGDQVWTRSSQAGQENVWTSNDGLQRKGEFNLDKQGNLSFTDANTKAELQHKLDGSTLEKDANKNVTQVITPEGQKYNYRYNEKNQLTGMQGPDGISYTRMPDRRDSKGNSIERWSQDGTNKISEGTRRVDSDGTLRMKNAGEKERVIRSDGFEEKQGPNGEKLLAKEFADKSSITKNELNQVVETKTADGQIRKFSYDSSGKMHKMDLGKEGKWNSEDGGKNWTKEGSNPPETKKADFLHTQKGDLVEKRLENGKVIENIYKNDGSTLHAEGGKYTSQKNALKEEIKVGYDDKGQPNKFEDPKDKGAYWTSQDNKTWTKHNADGSEDKSAKQEKFSIGFDSQGNFLKQNNEKAPPVVERRGSDGSTTLVSNDGRKLSERIPDGKGGFTESTFKYDKDNRYEGKETKHPDGLIEKSDAFGRTTDVTKGRFHRSFNYENKDYPHLVTSYNDNGKNFSIDKAALANGQVSYKNDANAKEVRNGMFEVGKDGSMTLNGRDGFSLTDRIDGTKLVRNADGSMLDYRADGKLNSTRDVNGYLKSYKYDLSQDVLGRTGQLSAVTYGEGSSAVTYRTNDGFNWRSDTGKTWKGFSSVDHASGVLTDKHYYGSVTEHGLDGKDRQPRDKQMTGVESAADEIKKAVDYVWNSSAIEHIRPQMEHKSAEEIRMMKEIYKEKTGNSLYMDLYNRFDKGSDTHRWAEVKGYLSKTGKAGEDSAIKLAVDAQEIDRWWWNRDRSKDEIRQSTRNILGSATEAERQSYVDAYKNIYGRDLKSEYQQGGVANAILNYDQYHKTLIGTALETGKDKRTPEQEAAILNAALKSGSKKLDYFMEASGGLVSENGRNNFLENGGKQKIEDAFTETHYDEAGGSYEVKDKFKIQQATDFAETGELRAHTAIKKAAGVFSNDDNVIEHTLNKLSQDQRAQFADGMKLSKLTSQEKAALGPKEQESLKFYDNMMDSFKSLHYFGAERKAEKYIDQTLHKGGTDVANKVAPIGGHWTNSNQVNAEAIENMDQKTFNTLMTGSKASVDENGDVKGEIKAENAAGQSKQFVSEFHRQMSVAMEKNLGSGEYIQKAESLLNKKVAEGVKINAAADKGDFDTLRSKVPELANIPDQKFNELKAGHDLEKGINSGEIDEAKLNPEQAAQLDAYRKDNVLRPFMEGREIARNLNDIETGARADRLFEGQKLEAQFKASGKEPNANEQAKIDFYKANAREIEGMGPHLKNQIIEKQKESFTKGLSDDAKASLGSYQKTLYESVKQNTGRDFVDKLKDNESFWGNDRKAMLDGVLHLKAEEREKLKADPNYGKELREELKEKFSNGEDNNARYQLVDNLLKQIETSDKKVPDAAKMGAKEELLAKAAGIDGYANKDAVEIVSNAIKDDKDGSKSAKLAEDPEFRKAAITALHGNEALYDKQIKPLLESGRLPSDELKERHTHIVSDGEGGSHTEFDSKAFFKEGVLDASPRALQFLNSKEGAQEREKLLNELKSPEMRKLAENIINQGEVKDEDRIRAFVLDAGASKEETLQMMKDMPEAKRMEMQNGYEEKYGNYRASILDKVDSKEYDEFYRATRHQDYTTEQDYLHAVKIVAKTDTGMGAALARNYNVTHLEALNHFSQIKSEAAAKGEVLSKQDQENAARGTEDRVGSFKDTKQATTDTVATGIVTVGSLAAAPFTAGTSLYALAGISLAMGATAATIKYGMMANDAGGAKTFAGDTFKYTALAFSNQLGAGHIGLGEASHLAGATTMQMAKTEAANLLKQAFAGGLGNTFGEGGRQLIDEGKLDAQQLEVAFAQGFVMTGVMAATFRSAGLARENLFKAGDAPNVPHAAPQAGAGADVVDNVVAAGGVTAVATERVVANAGKNLPDAPTGHVAPNPHSNPHSNNTVHSKSAGTQAGEELKNVLENAKANEAPQLHETPKESLVNKGPEADEVSRVSGQPKPGETTLFDPDKTVVARSSKPHADYTNGDFKANVNGKDVPLDKQKISLGRADGKDLQFNDGRVSGNHAEIEFKPDGPVIRDSGSKNGTFVNGTKVEAGQELRLKPGDKIRLGPATEFTFGVKPEFHFDVNGRPIDLSPGGTNIGRSSENGLVLADNAVSRKHANITNTEAGPVIKDLGSTNGTYVNGTRLKPDEPTLLKPGDKVKFGKDGPEYVLGKGSDAPSVVHTKPGLEVKPREVMHYKVKPGEANPAASPEAVKSSNSYKEYGEVREPVRDGFQTLSGDRPIKADGTFDDPHRPSLVVDRTRDNVLNDTIAEAHKRFDHLRNDPRKLAEELTRFSKEKMHPRGWTEEQVTASYNEFRGQNKGKQVLLGDYIDRAAKGEGAGVCQHQALLNKVLGDEFGLDVSLVAGYYGNKPPGGFPKDTFGNHAWNEYHIDGKTYVFDPRHEKFGKTAAEMPKHTPARVWLTGPDAQPVGRFDQLDLKPGQIVNHDGGTNWTVSTAKPETPGNIVLTTSATKGALADEVAALNGNKPLVVGEKYSLKRSSGQVEDGWQLMGKREDGSLQFYKADAIKKEVTPQQLLRDNPDVLDVHTGPDGDSIQTEAPHSKSPDEKAPQDDAPTTKAQPEKAQSLEEPKVKSEEGDLNPGRVKDGADAPVMPKKVYDPAEALDTARIKEISKAFSDGTKEVPLSKEQFESIFKGMSEADRKLALEIMEQSAPNMTPRALDDQLRNLQKQFDKLDPALRKDGITVFTFKGDDSGEMMAQLLRKNNDQLKINVLELDASAMQRLKAEGMPDKAVVLGDLAQANAAQKELLSSVKNLYASDINGFDRGMNFLDFGASQFSGPKGMQDKLNGLVEKAKALQSAEHGLTNEDAVRRVLQGDSAKHATEIGANVKTVQPEASLAGKELRAQVGGDDAYKIGSIYEQLTAPQLTPKQMEQYLASLKNPEIRGLAAHVLENGVEYKPYTQMMKEYKQMHDDLLSKLPPGTDPKNVLLVTGLEQQAEKMAGRTVDNSGSQMVAAKLYARANDLGPENFISASELAARGPGAANGKVLVYVDDFSLSGRQAAGIMHNSAPMLKDSGGKVVVATLGKFDTDVDAWKLWQSDPARYGNLKDLDVTVLSNKTYQPFYTPDKLSASGLAGQETRLGQYNAFKPGHDSGLATYLLTPYGGPNNNMKFLDDLAKDTGLRGNSKFKLKYENPATVAQAPEPVKSGPKFETPKDTPEIKADPEGWEYKNEHGKSFVLKDGNTPLHVKENVTVYAEAGTKTEFHDQSRGVLKGKDTAALAKDQAQVDVTNGAKVEAEGKARVFVHDDSQAVLRESSSATLKDNATARVEPGVFDSPKVDAKGNSVVTVESPGSSVLKRQPPDIKVSDNAKAVLNADANVTARGQNASVSVNQGVKNAQVQLSNGSQVHFNNSGGVVTGDGVIRISGDNAHVVIDAGNKPVKVIVESGNPTIEVKNGKNVEFQTVDGSNPKISNNTENTFRQKIINTDGADTGKFTELKGEGSVITSRDGRPIVGRQSGDTIKQTIEDIRKVDPELADELLREPVTMVNDLGNGNKGIVRITKADPTGEAVHATSMEEVIKNPQKYPDLNLTNAEHELAGHRAFDLYLNKQVTDPQELAKLGAIRQELVENNLGMNPANPDPLRYGNYLNSPPELAADFIGVNGSISRMQKDIASAVQAGEKVPQELMDTYNKTIAFRKELEKAMYKVQQGDPGTKFYFDKAREFSAKMHPDAFKS